MWRDAKKSVEEDEIYHAKEAIPGQENDKTITDTNDRVSDQRGMMSQQVGEDEEVSKDAEEEENHFKSLQRRRQAAASRRLKKKTIKTLSFSTYDDEEDDERNLVAEENVRIRLKPSQDATIFSETTKDSMNRTIVSTTESSDSVLWNYVTEEEWEKQKRKVIETPKLEDELLNLEDTQTSQSEILVDIPDDAFISTAKKNREMRRHMNVMQMNSMEVDEDYEKKSRYLREEDEIEEVDEDNRPIGIVKFGTGKSQLESKEDSENFVIGVEDDEEVKRWESDLIRKTTRGSSKIPNDSHHGIENVKKFQGRIAEIRAQTKNLHAPMQFALPVIQDMHVYMKTVVSDLEQQKQSLDSESEMRRHELEMNATSLVRLRVQFAETSSQYTFYRELQRYVENLATMLSIKMPILDRIENELLELRRERHFHETEDQTLDDDDEETLSHFSSNEARLLEEAAQLLNDVEEDFQSIASVKKRFEEWKRYYKQSYNDTYVSFALSGVFEFYVRLELLKWNPLNYFTHLDEFSWVQVLKTYGVVDNNSVDTNLSDREPNLLSSILEKIIMPRFSKILTACFNPSDIEATRYVLKTISNIEEILDPQNSSFLTIRLALEEHFDTAITAELDAAKILESDRPLKLFECLFELRDRLSIEVLVKNSEKLLNRVILPRLQFSDSLSHCIHWTHKIIMALPISWFSEEAFEPLLEPFRHFVSRNLTTKCLSSYSMYSDVSLTHLISDILLQDLITIHLYEEASRLAKQLNMKPK